MKTSKLSIKIREFLKTYASTCPGDETEYSSPDAYQLEFAADELDLSGTISKLPWSEWGSGGYKPYYSKEGRKIHDDIISLLMTLLNETRMINNNIGKQCQKKTGKPFKSGQKINTIKSIITHPILKIPAYTFFEDHSFVDCKRCETI